MGRRNQSPALFTVALLLFAAATPLVHGQPEVSEQVVVYGRLCCTPTGNCPGGPGIPGIRVRMGHNTTDGGYNVVDESMTGLSGTFTLVNYGFAGASLIQIGLNAATAVTPAAACSSLSTASLVGVPMHISTDVTPLLGLVGKYWVQWVPTNTT